MTQTIDHAAIEAALARHERVGFQLSGGRDSTAALYAMRPYWGRMTVYTLDTGDRFPETAAVIDAIEADLGSPVVRIETSVEYVREHIGLASDLAPTANATELGRMVSGEELRIIDRYECCWHAVMAPMHQRMLDDGITLIVRGQRDSDYARTPTRSGDGDGERELLYPIQHWSDADVMDFITRCDLPVAAFYAEGLKTAPECMSCTAWWDEGRFEYLRKHHPDTHAAVKVRMRQIKIAVDRHYKALPDIE